MNSFPQERKLILADMNSQILDRIFLSMKSFLLVFPFDLWPFQIINSFSIGLHTCPFQGACAAVRVFTYSPPPDVITTYFTGTQSLAMHPRGPGKMKMPLPCTDPFNIWSAITILDDRINQTTV